MLLSDQSVQVQKRAVQAARLVYRSGLQHLSNAPYVTEEMEQAWNYLCQAKVLF